MHPARLRGPEGRRNRLPSFNTRYNLSEEGGRWEVGGREFPRQRSVGSRAYSIASAPWAIGPGGLLGGAGLQDVIAIVGGQTELRARQLDKGAGTAF